MNLLNLIEDTNTGYDNLRRLMDFEMDKKKQPVMLTLGGEQVKLDSNEAHFMFRKYEVFNNAGRQKEFIDVLGDPVKFDQHMKQLRNLIAKQENFRGSVEGGRDVDEGRTQMYSDGDRVKLNSTYANSDNPNEIYTVAQCDQDRKRCWIGDKSGSGWYVTFDQIIPAISSDTEGQGLGEQAVSLGNNDEYNDESGMAYNSLRTIHRATKGLANTIKDGDNLPEWCQEKISLAEDYLVTVWDYLQSEKGMAEGLGTSPDRLLARTGMNNAHKFPRDGQTNLGNIPGMNTPDASPETKAYADQQRAKRPGDLKAAIRGQLGKHHKPNLPEQDVEEGLTQILRKFDPTIKARIRSKSQDQTNQGIDTIRDQEAAGFDPADTADMHNRELKPNTYFRNAARYAKLANKDVAEGLGYSQDQAQAKWYHEGRMAFNGGTTGNLIQDIAKKHGCPPEWLKAFRAGYQDQKGFSKDGVAEGDEAQSSQPVIPQDQIAKAWTQNKSKAQMFIKNVPVAIMPTSKLPPNSVDIVKQEAGKRDQTSYSPEKFAKGLAAMQAPKQGKGEVYIFDQSSMANYGPYSSQITPALSEYLQQLGIDSAIAKLYIKKVPTPFIPASVFGIEGKRIQTSWGDQAVDSGAFITQEANGHTYCCNPDSEGLPIGYIPAQQGVAEARSVDDLKNELTSWKKEGPWKKTTTKDPRGKAPNLSDRARRETEKMSNELNPTTKKV